MPYKYRAALVSRKIQILLVDLVLMPRSTETDAYIFIKKALGEIGWVARNPARNPNGQVYTQNEVPVILVTCNP